jgi:maltose alpha-D-glucosyltransferase/alpha-amylase
MTAADNIRRPPLWYRDAVIYEVHVRAFADSNGDGIGDFGGLTSRLDYLQQLGVTAIWLLPFYPSPLRDDGYDIADYLDVHPSYGTLEDFEHFLREAHARNMHVITELVINHTSDQHPWFQRARRAAAGTPERDFYVWSDTDDRYPEVRIIFSDTEASNWAWDAEAEAYYWHRFFSHQPDLNWDSPDVREAVIEALDFWLDLGVDGLRLDAIPYLHEREGTNGENLPETHEELRRLRAHVDAKYGDRMLLAEANQWPEDSVAYFGDGDECHMAFHFPLMPRLYLALERENRLPIIDILEQTPQIPDNATWAIFLRNHDELTLEMVSEEERDEMWRAFSPDRRARLNLGIRRRLAPLLENDRRRIELLNSLLLSLPGTPVIYYGDEIGMGDNIFLADRDGVRTPMQWSNDRNAGFSKANPQSLYLPLIVDPQFHFETVNVEAESANPNSLLWWMRRMIRRRRRHPALGRGTIRFLEPDNVHVLTYLREAEEETVLVVANLSRHAQYVELDLAEFLGSRLIEVLGNTEFPTIGDLPYLLSLGPYGFYWFTITGAEVGISAARAPVAIPGNLDDIFDSDNSLADNLARYAATQIWYQGRGRRRLGAGIADAIAVPVQDEQYDAWLVILDVEYVTGAPERYVVPLGLSFGASPEVPETALIGAVVGEDGSGTLFDALFDSRFCDALRRAIADNVDLLGRTGSLVSRHSTAEFDFSNGEAQPVIEQTTDGESFVQYRPGLTLKLFRSIDPGISPDLELRQFLTERTSFEKLSPVYGSIEYSGRDSSTVGIMQGALDPELTAWTLFGDLCSQFLDAESNAAPPQVDLSAGWTAAEPTTTTPPGGPLHAALGHATSLGVTTAEFHQALASHTEEPSLRPEPFTHLYRQALYQSLRAGLRQELSAIRRFHHNAPADQRDLLQRLYAGESAMLARLDPIRRRPISGQRTRVHGKYRLDELRMVDGEFFVLDLSGDHTRPIGERRLKASPLRDIAEMLRSFEYVAGATANDHSAAGVQDHALYWYRAVGRRFIHAYLEASAGASSLPTAAEDIESLLAAFEMTKALREVHWEIIHRPEWLPIALAGALRRIQ